MGNFSCINERDPIEQGVQANNEKVEQLKLAQNATNNTSNSTNQSTNPNSNNKKSINSSQNNNSASHSQVDNKTQNKASFNNRKLQKLKQKYGMPNYIEEEGASGIYQTILSDIQFNNGSSLAFFQEGSIQQRRGVLDVINDIRSYNPEGEMILSNSVVILRHLNSEQHLHSHFRYLNEVHKMQEVVVCCSKAVHSHDFWVLQTPQLYYEILNSSNKIWAKQEEIQEQIQCDKKREQQIDEYVNEKQEEEEPQEDQQSKKDFQIKIQKSFIQPIQISQKQEEESACQGKEETSNTFSTGCGSPMQQIQGQQVKNGEEVILQHFMTSKELTANGEKVFCDELVGSFDQKKKYNWKILVNNKDGIMRDNSIIQIIHSETSQPMKACKQQGILSQSLQVILGNIPYFVENENVQLSDFWIINRVQEQLPQDKQSL